MGLAKCEKCGSEIKDDDAEFCPRCGSLLKKPMVCTKCGNIAVDLNAEFCSKCGNRIEENMKNKKCWNCGFEILDPKSPCCPKCTVLLDQTKPMIKRSTSNYDYGKNIKEIIIWGGVLLISLVIAGGIISIINPNYQQNIQETKNYPVTANPTISIDQIKKDASSPSWDDLFRYNERYVGEVVHYRGQIIQSQNTFGDNYEFRIATKKNEYGSYYSDDIIYINFKGSRLLEDDIVDVWGKVKGLKSYTTVLGNEITIPEIDAIDIVFIERSY